ncbi:putative integral membrane protein [Thermoplasmatales archaeon]|nr:putative integral membrane protein [Thermoplasmatales archaeon]
MLLWIIIAVLFVHIFSAIFFIGGSFFIWFIVWPVSYKLTEDETYRTRIVGLIGRLFGYYTNALVIVLVGTGIFLGYEYLPRLSDLETTTGGQILLEKSIIVAIMLILMYANNIYHGKKIMRLSEEKKYDEMERIRRITHVASFVTMGLMIVITILAVSLQFYVP